MSNKHTPGPWRADGTHIQTPVGGRIAYMANRDEQALADARLIAAAPDMRSLLLQIHTELSHVASDDEDEESWEGHTLRRIEKLLWPEGNK